ncbi:hypothetical protein NM208_g6812 [Fusarium decemcellulare]|uniref:Uncharacterized protein n=1 Tax=Fusarium decemcellulare TaxID=57161 RepID=A0ACC1SBJ8_9HYPO|nr:hypothetical protein NM208_g6812 [Fusarium decemcellulare]
MRHQFVYATMATGYHTPSHHNHDHQDGSGTMTQLDITSSSYTRKFFIFGHNIAHSLSPTLHNAGFKHLDLLHHYAIHESEQVDETVGQIIRSSDFGGASVTFPHKLQIGALLDSVSPRGKEIGAINTIVVREVGSQRVLHGDNTDWIGIKRCIEKSGVHDLESSAALVLGAGGAARAACYAIQDLGITNLVLVNRTLSKAEEMASHLSNIRTQIFPTLQEAVASVISGVAIRLVVACVPADDLGQDQIPPELFSRGSDGVLIEMAYRPHVTGMMTVATQYPGWAVYRGIDVLEEQAYAQFELWTGKQAPVEAMRAAMMAKVRSNI